MTEVHVVVPDIVRRADRPSGGNTYDNRACSGLRALGWSVHEHLVAGAWPDPTAETSAALTRLTNDLPDGALVLVDGLIASNAADVLVPHAGRLRLAVLVHLPLGHAEERRVLLAAAAVVTTSEWTRRRLVDLYALDPAVLHVATPGVDRAGLAPGTAAGGKLLCVAAVTPGKGHDRLLTALADVSDLPWDCVCAGSLTLDPAHVAALHRQRQRLGLANRVHFVGPLSGVELDRAYAGADVLVLSSHAETYAMVVTEALARGLPVIATAVGGVPEALGRTPHGEPPGLLVAEGDPAALADALRSWLTDAALRSRLRGLARERRLTLADWTATSRRLADALRTVARPTA